MSQQFEEAAKWGEEMTASNLRSPDVQGIGVWPLGEEGGLSWEGIGPCDWEGSDMCLSGQRQEGMPLSSLCPSLCPCFSAPRALSLRWDGRKMEMSNSHGTVT